MIERLVRGYQEAILLPGLNTLDTCVDGAEYNQK